MTDASSFFVDPNDDKFDCIQALPSSGSISLSYLVSKGGKQFFLKQLQAQYRNNQRYQQLFKKEYHLGCQVNHPHIVRYQDYGENSDGPYILMEYISGETLSEKLSKNPAYFRQQRNLNKFFHQLLDALQYLHQQHLVFCDLKPDNIMLTRINNDVKIVDLGFCDSDTYSHSAGMNPLFAAPEQLEKQDKAIDARTDIYAIGKLLEYIETACGKRLSLKYRRAMHTCLKEDKSKRFDSIQELSDSLQRRSKKIWWTGSLLLLLIAGSIAYIPFRQSDCHRKMMVCLHKDACKNGLYYQILSEDSATCCITGRQRQLKDSRTGKSNLYILDHIDIDNKRYTTTKIADYAFCNDDNVASVNIPKTVKEIGEQAFMRNVLLSSVHIPEGVTHIQAKSFYRCGISNVKLSSGLKKIGHAAFALCHQLKQVEIPEGVEVLDIDAFGECKALQSIDLPSSLKSINRGVFWKCSSLKEIYLPAGVENIGEYAFYYCDSLQDVYNAAPEPQPISVIFNRKDIRVHVPAASAEKYRQAQHWRDMIIVADLP